MLKLAAENKNQETFKCLSYEKNDTSCKTDMTLDIEKKSITSKVHR